TGTRVAWEAVLVPHSPATVLELLGGVGVGEVSLRPVPAVAVGRRSAMAEPGEPGRFGDHGGRFVPESLVPACLDLERAFRESWADPRFRRDLDRLLAAHAGRPTALTPAWRLSAEPGIT